MKMKIIWTPELRKEQEWVVDRHNPSWDVAYPVETATDWGWLQFLQRLDGMSPRAWRALLWALRKQEEHRLPLESIEIDWSELDFLILCPGCNEWVEPQGHLCDYAAIIGDAEDGDAPDEVGPKKAGRKKAGEPDPEA